MNDTNDVTTGASVYYGVLTTITPSATDIQGLATKTLGSGSYDGSFDQSLASAGFFTVAIPVSWRNPALKIGGDDTWNVLNATKLVTINNISYQVWQPMFRSLRANRLPLNKWGRMESLSYPITSAAGIKFSLYLEIILNYRTGGTCALRFVHLP